MHPNKALSDFKPWVARFQARGVGEAALRLLDKHFPDNRGGESVSFFGKSLRNIVLRACFCAESFSPNEDPDERRRRINRKALNQLKKQRASLRRVRGFLNDYEPALQALARAHIALRAEGIFVEDGSRGANDRPGPYRDIRARYLRVLKALEDHLIEYDEFSACSPFTDNNSYGCLLYQRPLDAAKARAKGVPNERRPGVKNLLLFDLVQLFKLTSQGKVRKYRDTMPNTGEACYPVAVAFLRATLPTKQPHKNIVRSFTKSFTGKRVAYCDWPVVRELNERKAEHSEFLELDKWEHNERTIELGEWGN